MDRFERSFHKIASITICGLVISIEIFLGYKSYRNFWSLEIVEDGRIHLNYWFPVGDPVLGPGEIREIRLIEVLYKWSTGKVERLAISLVTGDGREYTSVDLLKEETARKAISALQESTGLKAKQYFRAGHFQHPRAVSN